MRELITEGRRMLAERMASIPSSPRMKGKTDSVTAKTRMHAKQTWDKIAALLPQARDSEDDAAAIEVAMSLSGLIKEINASMKAVGAPLLKGGSPSVSAKDKAWSSIIKSMNALKKAIETLPHEDGDYEAISTYMWDSYKNAIIPAINDFA